LRQVGGRRIIDRVADALRGVVNEIVLVANAAEADQWLRGARVAQDSGDARGSLVGLQTALQAAQGSDALVVAWDMPFVSGKLLRFVASRLSSPILAAVPELAGGLEPFCAAYSARCLPLVERQLAHGDLRVASFIDTLPVVRRIGESELSPLGEPARLFFNVNSAADLTTAERMARED
jgi:molybdopterin-guanine dinucleotide biosynthesis protein A